MKRGVEWWDRWFLGMADYVSTASKDPSTQTGGVIVRPDKSIVSLGFNGFPRNMEDRSEWLENREEKYNRVVHSELNAILNARQDVRGCTLYNWPGRSCSRCAVHVIQAGIVRVVSPYDPASSFNERWKEDQDTAQDYYENAGVEVVNIDISN